MPDPYTVGLTVKRYQKFYKNNMTFVVFEQGLVFLCQCPKVGFALGKRRKSWPQSSVIRYNATMPIGFLNPIVGQLRWLAILILVVWLGRLPSGAAEAMPSSLQQANQLAEAGRFAEAAAQYEAFYRQHPGDARLRRNLVTLYINAAGQALQAQQPQQALTQLDKARHLVGQGSPDADLAKLTAYAYLQQSQQLQESGSSSDEILTLLEKAQHADPTSQPVKGALANFWLQQANDCRLRHAYDEALSAARKAQALLPQEQAIAKSVANLALSAAYHSSDKDQQNAYLEQAVAASSDAEIQRAVERFKQERSPLAKVKAANPLSDKPAVLDSVRQDHPFLVNPTTVGSYSLLQQVQQLEAMVGLVVNAGTPLHERVSALETSVLGSVQPGGLQQRVAQVYQRALGQPQALGADQSYTHAILQVTAGKVARFSTFPLRLYVAPPPSVERASSASSKKAGNQDPAAALPPSVRQAIDNSVLLWRKATLGYVDVVWVASADAADVVIDWVPLPQWKDPLNEAAIAERQKVFAQLADLRPSKVASVLRVASAFTPGYFSAIPQVGSALANLPAYQTLAALRQENRLQLPHALVTLQPGRPPMALQNALTYQFGVVLGLKAKGPVGQSLMGKPLSQALQDDTVWQPTPADLATLRTLYLMPVDLPLNSALAAPAQ